VATRSDRLLGRPLEVTQFICALPYGSRPRSARVHERNLIHRDIKPAMSCVDMASGGAWLTGFGIASRLPREHQIPELPEVIAGTTRLHAPEHDGQDEPVRRFPERPLLLWGSRSRDAHGVLPFQCLASDGVGPLSHRPPADPASERVKEIPGPISAIVLKLLAKTAEDRTRPAAGVEADLRSCLRAWKRTAASIHSR